MSEPVTAGQQGLGTPFLPYLRQRIEDIKQNNALTKKGLPYSRKGKYSYGSAIKYIDCYQQETQTIFPGAMDEEWFEQFIVFLTSKPLRRNTIASIIRRVKSILRRQCKNEKIPFLAIDVSYGPELTTKVYLGRPELDMIEKLELTKSLAYIRDAFLIQAGTGLRFSDLKKLLADPKAFSEEVNEHTFFTLRQQKTGGDVVIPASKTVLRILTEREWKFPKRWSIQLYNRRMKEIAQAAGLTHTVPCYYTSQGQPKCDHIPKHLLVSSHTARRTFATNAFLAGVPVLNIMQITGHTSQAAFMLYIRANGMQSAMSIAGHAFFNQ